MRMLVLTYHHHRHHYHHRRCDGRINQLSSTLETEKLHAKVRRYTSPEEHPFYEALLPSPVLAELNFPQLLKGNKSDVNVKLDWWHIVLEF